MISNLSISVKLGRVKQGVFTAVVDYTTAEDVEKVVKRGVKVGGTDAELEVIKFIPKEKADLKGKQRFRSKVYIGNLPEDYTEETFKNSLTNEVVPKVLFLSKNKGKKYAFLEFNSDAERNVAIGALERIKQGGAFGDDAIVSPAYPYAQKPKNYRRGKKVESESSNQ